MRLPSKFDKKLCGASATWAKADQNEQMNCRLGSFGESNHDLLFGTHDSSGLFQRDHKGPGIGHHERIADRDVRKGAVKPPFSPLQRRLQNPPAKSNFLAVRANGL